MNPYTIIIGVIVLIVLASIRQINQYQKGVKFMLGKYVGLMGPGWRIVVPIFQSYRKVELLWRIFLKGFLLMGNLQP